MKLFGPKPKNQFAPRVISARPEHQVGKKVIWGTVSAIIVSVLVAVGWQYAQTSLFTIRSVKLEKLVATQPSVVPEDQMQKLSRSVEGRTLLLLDITELSNEWAHKFPTVSSFEMEKRYPDTLVVRYIPRVAYSQLVSPEGTYLVDRSGFIFAEAAAEDLPKLTTDASVPGVGKRASAKGIALGMHLIEGLRNVQPPLKSIVLSEGQLEVDLASQPRILINEDRIASQTVKQIKAMLAKFEQDKSYPKEIDMRYERPVLRY